MILEVFSNNSMTYPKPPWLEKSDYLFLHSLREQFLSQISGVEEALLSLEQELLCPGPLSQLLCSTGGGNLGVGFGYIMFTLVLKPQHIAMNDKKHLQMLQKSSLKRQH